MRPGIGIYCAVSSNIFKFDILRLKPVKGCIKVWHLTTLCKSVLRMVNDIRKCDSYLLVVRGSLLLSKVSVLEGNQSFPLWY